MRYPCLPYACVGVRLNGPRGRLRGYGLRLHSPGYTVTVFEDDTPVKKTSERTLPPYLETGPRWFQRHRNHRFGPAVPCLQYLPSFRTLCWYSPYLIRIIDLRTRIGLSIFYVNGILDHNIIY